ncbi:MAG: hypothetical protein E7430_06735 [Ruminococcaceae bacterium]|nr:hypothetical protein [Oscillospiraceae bacterium]
MKRITALVLIAVMLAALVGCSRDSENSSPKMYVEPAQLNKDEENMAKLLGEGLEDNLIYDFVLDDTVQSMQVAVYELIDGQWDPISDGYLAFTDTKGRIALGFDKLCDGYRVATQSEKHSGSTKYGTISEEDTSVMGYATSILSENAELVYGKEQPLAVQIMTSKNEIRSYTVEYFHTPEEYLQYGYEHVYAITIAFSQQTVGEIDGAHD